jgi:hypothetical protein
VLIPSCAHGCLIAQAEIAQVSSKNCFLSGDQPIEPGHGWLGKPCLLPIG